MMRKSALSALFIAVLLGLNSFSYSQPLPIESGIKLNDPKPYKLLTTGKQVTIRSEKTIKSVMLWTASGHRILEQKDVNALEYTIYLTVREKVFFVMIMLENGKHYTEKFGVR